MKILLMIIAMCWSVNAFAAETRLNTSLHGLRFNQILSQYTEGPTRVLLVEKKKRSILDVEVELFGYLMPGVPQTANMRFLSSEVSSYLALLDKYSEWEKLALSRGDQFTKDIGRHKDAKGKLLFTFHSGNAQQHYLVVSFCSFGTCLKDQAAYFDRQGVEELKRLLTQLAEGKLKTLTVDDVYK